MASLCITIIAIIIIVLWTQAPDIINSIDRMVSNYNNTLYLKQYNSAVQLNRDKKTKNSIILPIQTTTIKNISKIKNEALIQNPSAKKSFIIYPYYQTV